MMFCLTIIAIIGIISAVIFFSKGQISFNLKAHTTLPDKSEADIGFEVDKEDIKEDR